MFTVTSSARFSAEHPSARKLQFLHRSPFCLAAARGTGGRGFWHAPDRRGASMKRFILGFAALALLLVATESANAQSWRVGRWSSGSFPAYYSPSYSTIRFGDVGSVTVPSGYSVSSYPAYTYSYPSYGYSYAYPSYGYTYSTPVYYSSPMYYSTPYYYGPTYGPSSFRVRHWGWGW